MKNIAILLAAGKSIRMGMGFNKTLIEVEGKPLLWYSLKVLEQCELINEIMLIVQRDIAEYVKINIVDKHGFGKVKKIVEGGNERQFSVYNGLFAINEADVIVVHDGARPLITESMVVDVITAAYEYGSSTVGVPLKDTVKMVDGNNLVKYTPDRNSMWIIQTPQAFRFDILKTAHEKAIEDGFIATDDCALVERIGGTVKIVEGNYRNIKVTTPEDLVVLEALIRI
ncbi:MAG: 2-C-methyl-D-erythritol 4-phosphate cytidylyltransferase [Thermoanaerobacteraceae bacterium]|nr:2-C-methyl-D-erythritol 4-phosphate cytidylyltransferase [Thermoanaerobacteraceae bacterium]